MSRAKRTRQFRVTVKKQWTLKYWDFIQENLECWNWGWISKNPNITMDIIRENPDKPWNWEWISWNPNITFDIIREKPDKPWNWEWISLNKFQKEKQLFIEKSFTKYLSAYKIQQWWLHITMSPYYKIGRKFIDRSTNELMDEYNGMI